MSEALHAEDLPQEETYRSVSWGAIGVLIGGLLSPLAFVSPLLWFIPLAVLLAAVWVLRNLAANSDRLTGAKLAWIGLAITILILGWAPARHTVRMNRISGDARRIADTWAEMLNRRETQAAHQWTLNSSERAEAGTSLGAFYGEQPERQKALQQYFERPPLKRWLALKNPQTTFVAVVKQHAVADAEEVVLKYMIRGESQPEKGEAKPETTEFPLWIIAVRLPTEPGKYEMKISGVVDSDPVPLGDN